MHATRPEDVLGFWFNEIEPKDWFSPTPYLDTKIRERFLQTYLDLVHAPPKVDWTTSADAVLAALIVLDQMSRNMFRGTPLAFSGDCVALPLAQLALEKGFDMQVDAERRIFFYLPFEHSEKIEHQHHCVTLFESLENANYLDYAHRHRDVILKFGRFPHRNPILRRESTEAEMAYLGQPGAGF
jgi:uncharacterized protein (DUF924 family)